MSVTTTLKRLAGLAKTDTEAVAAAYAAISAELSDAKNEFEIMQATYSARVTAALVEGLEAKADQVDAEVYAGRRKVERLERAREAVAQRLQAAQEAAKAAEIAKRWDAAERAINRRRLALVRFERVMSEAGAALVAAEDAAREAWEALPAKDGNGPHFASLAGEVHRLMAISTDGRAGGYVGSGLWEIRRQPSLVERADAGATEWLKRRPGVEAELPPDAA